MIATASLVGIAEVDEFAIIVRGTFVHAFRERVAFSPMQLAPGTLLVVSFEPAIGGAVSGMQASPAVLEPPRAFFVMRAPVAVLEPRLGLALTVRREYVGTRATRAVRIMDTIVVVAPSISWLAMHVITLRFVT